MKYSLGISVSGMEIRLAVLSNNKGRVRVEAVDKATLKSPLDLPAPEVKTNGTDDSVSEAFGFSTSDKTETGPTPEGGDSSDNLEVVYALLQKYAKNKIKVGINVPLSMVNYHRRDSVFPSGTRDNGERPSGIDSSPNWVNEVVKGKDGSLVEMNYEQHPPTLALVRGAQSFMRGKFLLALMDTTELALVSMARRSFVFEPDKYTAIVCIEDDFSRIVFLHGSDLFHVTPIIHEHIGSTDILDVIYRKLIYEQDEANIPAISSVLLAGRSNRVNAREFFSARFPGVQVGYLFSHLLEGMPANDKQRDLFSGYAVPIALAWKVLQPQHPHFVGPNLLPQELLDQQELLKLAYHGYILLALTGLTAFFFSWQVISTHGEIRRIHLKNTQLEQKIKNNQATVDRVLDLEEQSKRIEKNLQLAGNLSEGHDEFLAFLQKLNTSTQQTGGLWIDEITKQKDGFTIKGSSFRRDNIPLLAEVLGQASLRRMTRDDEKNRRLFRFEVERQNTPQNFSFSSAGIRIINGRDQLRQDDLRLERLEQPPDASKVTSPPVAPPATKNQERAPGTTPAREQVVRTPIPNDLLKLSTNNEQQSSAPPPASPPKVATTPAIFRTPSETSAQEARALEPPRSLIENQALVSAFGSPSGNSSNAKSTPNSKSRATTPEPSTTTEVVKDTQPAIAGTGTANPVEPNKPVAAPVRGYSIEAAATYTKSLAEKLATAFRQKDLDAAVDDLGPESEGGKRYRVLVGSFTTRPAAEQMAEQIAGNLAGNYRIVALR